MATIRHHVRIDRPAADVWATVSDAGAISRWFPLIEESSAEGSIRKCTMKGGGKFEEEIVTSDEADTTEPSPGAEASS